jgi:ribosomal protein S27AE
MLWRTQFSRTCPLCGNANLRVNREGRYIECGRGHWWLFSEAERYQKGQVTEDWLVKRIAARDRLTKEAR